MRVNVQKAFILLEVKVNFANTLTFVPVKYAQVRYVCTLRNLLNCDLEAIHLKLHLVGFFCPLVGLNDPHCKGHAHNTGNSNVSESLAC